MSRLLITVWDYGDARLEELIPYLEKTFRILPQPYACVLTGGSTRGWEALTRSSFPAYFVSQLF
jgi:enterochelin esterase-like enzyme